MRALLVKRAIALVFLCLFGLPVISQSGPSQESPPFPITANSSTIVPSGSGTKVNSSSVSSTTLTGTGLIQTSSSGVTATSSTSNTTTTAVRKCAKGCSDCGAARPPPTPMSGSGYLTGTNGLAYLAASTLTALPTDVDVVSRRIAPKEAGISGHNLHKRTLTSPYDAPWNGNVGAWLLRAVRQPGTRYLAHSDQRQWFTTSITEQLRNGIASWSLAGMEGCTALIVVSRKRIFMAHIWEIPTMDNSENTFQRDALNVFADPLGDERGVGQGLSAFTAAGEDFYNTAENPVHAMIITPYKTGVTYPQPDDLEHPVQVQHMKTMLNNVLRLGGIGHITHIPYRRRARDPYWQSPSGKILIQYDPKQDMVKTGENRYTQLASLEVWFEELSPTPRHRDRWWAFPNQLVPAQPGSSRRLIRERVVADEDEHERQEYPSVLKRQDGVCVRPPGTISTSQDPTTMQTSVATA